MKKKITALILITIFFNISVFAGENSTNETKRPALVIYNLKIEKDNKKYLYYSTIIPKTISKIIKTYNKYDVITAGEIQDYRKNIENAEDKRKYINSLKKLSTSTSADYLITGACSIDNNTLLIELQIFNSRGKELSYISKKSIEVGALLKDTIDDLTVKIIKEIDRFDKRNKKRFAPSPYLGLYRAFSPFTFGIETGRVNFLEKWKDHYNNTEFVNTFLTANITSYLGITANFEYFSADNEGKDGLASFFYFMGGTLEINFYLRPSRLFAAALSGGGGYSRSKIEIFFTDNPDPFVQADRTTISRDPLVKITAAIEFNIAPVMVRFGSSYTRIFYSGEALETYTIFMGMGYNI